VDLGAFPAAADFYATAVAAVPRDAYERRWSDEWRVIDLIGHGNRANLLAVEYYERPVQKAGPDYVTPEAIAERGRQAVALLGDDPPAAVRAAADRAVGVLGAAPDDAVAGTPFGTIPLPAYLLSRIAELVLHGLDLGTDVAPPDEALVACGEAIVSRAVQRGLGVEVVRALSGRAALPPGFNVF
jgi:hypothetical protein